MLRAKKEIIDWLDRYEIKRYTINDNLTVDVDDDVNISENNLTSIDVQFNIVNGYFNCETNQLTSLKGCPKIVYGSFYCGFNKLKNLEFCPTKVGYNFDCGENQLESLNILPDSIIGKFYCDGNTKLEQLQFISNFNEIKRRLEIEKNNKILDNLLKVNNLNKLSKQKI